MKFYALSSGRPFTSENKGQYVYARDEDGWRPLYLNNCPNLQLGPLLYPLNDRDDRVQDGRWVEIKIPKEYAILDPK